jgi:paraquat-inducible protein B
MSKPVNQTVIGIFVVVAIALVVAAVLVLGSGKFFKHNQEFVMYFQGSVKGLSVGSPVDFRGVKVGTVTDIRMLFNPKDLSIIIPVYVEIEEGSLEAVQGGQSIGAFRKLLSMKDLAQELIKHGLRAQLEMQSIVTGLLMVSLDFHPDKPATLVGADTRYPEIPTIPTSLEQLAKRLEKLPIEEIFAKLNEAIGGIEKLVDSPETAGTIKAIRQAVDETRSLAHNLNGQVNPLAVKITDVATQVQTLAGHIDNQIGPMASSITKTADEAGVTLKKAQATMGTIEDLTGEDSPVSYRIERTLDELNSAARSLRLLADTIQHQPNAVIFGKKKTGGK